jgi:cytoskeleton protein RodZ
VAPVPQAASPAPKKVAKVEPPKLQPIAPTVTTVPAGTNPSATPPANGAQTPATTAPQQQAAIPGKVYGQLNKNARVVLRMKQPTSVLVQGADGTTFINRTLNARDTYMVPDMVGLTLTTANAGAVEIDLDGVAMGAAGKNGQIGETLSLDPQTIADRYNGRQG